MNGRARAIGSGLLVTATSLALVGVATAAADDAPSHPEAARAATIRTGRSAGLRAARHPAARATRWSASSTARAAGSTTS